MSLTTAVSTTFLELSNLPRPYLLVAADLRIINQLDSSATQLSRNMVVPALQEEQLVRAIVEFCRPAPHLWDRRTDRAEPEFAPDLRSH